MEKNKYYGQEHAIEVLDMIADVSLNKDKYINADVSLPKGILLIGEPGVGKTLYAHKLTNRLNKELLIIKPSSNMISEEIESKFKLAKSSNNYIILLDELMAMINGDDKTKGQLLAELDSLSDVIVVATTTAREDQFFEHEALIRPGRFDLKIYLELPNREDRLDFLKDKLDNPLNLIDFNDIADITFGESYAFLTTLVNTTKLYAIQKNVDITTKFITWSAKKLNGFNVPEILKTSKELYPMAVHELGHTLYAILTNKIITKVQLSNSGAQGITSYYSKTNNHLANQAIIEIANNLSGYVASQIIFNKHTFGAHFDLEFLRNTYYHLHRDTLLFNNKVAVPFRSIGESETFEKSYKKRFNKFIKKTLKHTRHIMKTYKSIIEKYSLILANNMELSKDDLISLKNDIKGYKNYSKTNKNIDKFINKII